MLIYDHTKALIGIDDDDLHLLGFNMAKELFASCTDVADFFVKEPGHIHNFKNFQWIDFVLHAEAQNSRAIVDTGRKRFSCEILIRPFHLLHMPDNEAYAIYFQHVQPLELGEAAHPAAEPETPEPAAETAAAAPRTESAPAPEAAAAAAVELPKFDDVTERTLGGGAFEIPEAEPAETAFEEPYPDFSKPLEIEEDLYLGVEEEALPEAVPEAAPEAAPAEIPQEAAPFADYLTPEEQAYAEPLETFRDYRYDPSIAADELGLPVDLIEEFIGDFIKQSHDFHDPMFEAAAKDDYENLKLLSHKLKGVAANLRIEDAFEMLKTINSSHNHNEVEANLKMLYNTVARLEGKEPVLGTASQETAAESTAEPEIPVPEPEIPETAPAPKAEEDIYAFDVKEVVPEQAAAPSAEPESAAEEELYEFNVKHPEPVELPEETPAETEAPEPVSAPREEESYGMEDLYGFEKETPEITPEYKAPEEPERYGEPSETGLPEMPETEEMEEKPEVSAPVEPDIPAVPSEAVPPETEPFEPAVEPTVETPEPEFPAYDIQSVSSELGLPADIVAELKQDFIDHANSCRERFENALEHAQPDQWRGQAVQLKGIADNLRMNDIAMMMQELEATTDPLHAKALIERFYQRIEQL